MIITTRWDTYPTYPILKFKSPMVGAVLDLVWHLKAIVQVHLSQSQFIAE